jgi:hypothetical protein
MDNISISLAITLLGFFSNPVNADDNYTPDSSADITIQCTCVLVSPGCQNSVIDKLSGEGRNTWFQPGHVTAGQGNNLDAACYRKRDDDNFGRSLCCVIPDDESSSIKHLFRGSPSSP